MSGYLLALLIILAYLAIMIPLFKLKGEALKERGITMWGPFIMVRTELGKKFITKLAKPERFWNVFANFSIGLVVFFMIAMFALLLWEATIIVDIPAESAPTPQMLIGIPGINPIIPIWYGIWGLAVGIIIHEFAHGILTMVHKMKVKSLGLLFFIVPMGAFVEPDEEQLKTATRKKRMHVYSVGPGVNILFALACGAIFCWAFMGSIVPVSDGGPVTFVQEDTPAFEAGLLKGDFITSINGFNVTVGADFFEAMNQTTNAGETVALGIFHEGEGASTRNVTLGYWKHFDDIYQKDTANNTWYLEENASIGINVIYTPGRVTVSHVAFDSPAEYLGLQEGDMLVTLNGTPLVDLDTYNDTMASMVPGTNVSIQASRDNNTLTGDITPGAGKGYLGVSVSRLDLDQLAARLTRPGWDTKDFDSLFVNAVRFVGLPFNSLGPEDKLSPMEGLITEWYEVDGALGSLPEPLFWVMANLLYWAFWISLMVGLTNALPAVPMDGGYIFHDLMTGFASRFSKNEEKIEKTVDKIAILLALSVLFLILWQLIGPRIM